MSSEMEAALAEWLMCGEHDADCDDCPRQRKCEDDGDPQSTARRALAAARAHREAARSRRPAIEAWVHRWASSNGTRGSWGHILTAMLSHVRRTLRTSGPGEVAAILAAYDRAHAEPPQPEPHGPVVRGLAEALGWMAVGSKEDDDDA